MDPLRLVRRVFISSSYEDLKAHRAVVHDTLERIEQLPVDMAQFGARVGNPSVESVASAQESDIYIGIIAWRYGSIPAGETRSYTHQEYDEAIRQRKPCLIFLSDPKTEQQDGPDDLFPAATRNPDHEAQLLAFRDAVKTQIVDYFTTPDDLGRKVATALHHYLIQSLTLALPAEQRLPRELPPRMPGFVGREEALAVLTQALRRRQSIGVVAAVVGMGGVGKSTLAAEAVYQVTAEPQAFPGGVAFVRCDGRVGTEGQVWLYDQILQRWQHPLAPQELAPATTPAAMVEQREQALRSRLGLPGAALVLLDNVEKDLPLTPILDLFATLDITTLVTTRATPAAPRLQIYQLPVLSPEAAVELFAERYAARGGVWEPADDRGVALEVVSTLGYLPLAIELAAARAARLRQRTARLAQDLRQPGLLARLNDPADPTASVRYTLQKSLELLTPRQRSAFAALGLPDGPDWPYPVIITMLDALSDSDDEPTGESDLDLLVTLSLVDLAEAGNGTSAITPMRVRLHPLLRELAEQEWRQQSEETQNVAIAGLLQGVTILASENWNDFALLQQEEALITGAVRQAAQRKVAPQEVIAAVNALFDYVMTGSHWQLGMQLYQFQLAACREVGDRAWEGRALNNLGELARRLGRKVEAGQYYEQALAICREVRDREGEGTTLGNSGNLAYDLGEAEEAAEYYEQALTIFHNVGDQAKEGMILNNLGALTRSQGKAEEAARYYEQALAIHRDVGNRTVEGTTLNNLGELARSLGKTGEAMQYYEQALEICREVGDRAVEGTTLNNLGGLSYDLGRKEEAAQYYEQALAIHREVGNRAIEGTTLNNLGELARSLGRKEEAAQYYEQALAICREVGSRAMEGTTLNNLGRLADSLGKKEEAAQYYEQALSIFEEIGAVDNIRIVRENLDFLHHEMAGDDTTTLPQPADASGPKKRRWWQRR